MSYYGYGERQALQAVDYSAISQSFIDFINEERTTREKKRKEIQENLDQSLITLANTPQGTHNGTTNFVLNYTEQAQAILLDANRRLRSGELRLRDYNTIVNNLNRDTEILFGQAERLQADYATFEEKLKTGEAGAGDLVTREILEKFSRMDDHRAMINPTTGEAMIGALVPIDPNKPYNPTSNPYSNRISDKKDSMMFIGQLNSASSVTHAAFNEDEFNKDIDGIKGVMMPREETIGDMSLAIYEPTEQTKKAIRDFTESALTDSWKLYDYAVNNGLTEGYTLNGADDSKISFISDPNNPNGGAFAIDTESQAYKDLKKKAIDHLYNRGLNRKAGNIEILETAAQSESRKLQNAVRLASLSDRRKKQAEEEQSTKGLEKNIETFWTADEQDVKNKAVTNLGLALMADIQTQWGTDDNGNAIIEKMVIRKQGYGDVEVEDITTINQLNDLLKGYAGGLLDETSFESIKAGSIGNTRSGIDYATTEEQQRLKLLKQNFQKVLADPIRYADKIKSALALRGAKNVQFDGGKFTYENEKGIQSTYEPDEAARIAFATSTRREAEPSNAMDILLNIDPFTEEVSTDVNVDLSGNWGAKHNKN